MYRRKPELSAALSTTVWKGREGVTVQNQNQQVLLGALYLVISVIADTFPYSSARMILNSRLCV